MAPDPEPRYVCCACGAHSKRSDLCGVCETTELTTLEDAAVTAALIDYISAQPKPSSRWCAAATARARGPRRRAGRPRR